MPSWCENRIIIDTQTEEEKAAFLAAAAGPDGPLDFRAICPIPVVLEHGVEGCRSFEEKGRTVTAFRWLERRDAAGAVLEARPFTPKELGAHARQPHDTLFGWLDKMWGCRGTAQDVHLDDDMETTATIRFDTPWGPLTGIVETLRTRFPKVEVTAFFDTPDMEEAGYY